MTDSFIFFHSGHCIKMELLLHGVLEEHCEPEKKKKQEKNLHKTFICQDASRATISNYK